MTIEYKNYLLKCHQRGESATRKEVFSACFLVIEGGESHILFSIDFRSCDFLHP